MTDLEYQNCPYENLSCLKRAIKLYKWWRWWRWFWPKDIFWRIPRVRLEIMVGRCSPILEYTRLPEELISEYSKYLRIGDSLLERSL